MILDLIFSIVGIVLIVVDNYSFSKWLFLGVFLLWWSFPSVIFGIIRLYQKYKSKKKKK